MTKFESIWAYDRFWLRVLSEGRYCLGAEDRLFLGQVVASSTTRMLPVAKGDSFWRAQLGGNSTIEVLDDGTELTCLESVPYSADRMKPRSHCASEGRVNPKGIPCLYCATDRATAMSEVRPWKGAIVSVAEVVATRELRIADCTVDSERVFVPSWLGREVDSELMEKHIWWRINLAFSQPLEPKSEDTAVYAPTQILSEALRNAGYDGVRYRSDFGRGMNLAFFDLNAAEVTNCELFRVSGLEYAFEKVTLGE